jgi:catechol 2,3-dioxygenase-like lactoylglutathione lyase family enzyme
MDWKKIGVVQARVARPTDKLEEVVCFYRDGLGLEVIGGFEGHEAGSPCPAPTKDNLLVLYIPERAAVDALVERLAAHGHCPIPPENPYWHEKGLTFEDPDGWRVVLMNTAGI